ncbi:substrate-binding domain-containing protein [Psychromonas sp. KJ10-2]|uniref:substrate-binding domain-containing protein n=1 Tax=Psychromonas sp. KJ10-2 TaxID=3391822 RepID=UPI0039B6912B
MEDLLVAHGDKMNCAFAENDDMALGMVLALKAANKLDQVTVFSNDGYKKGLESIKRGELKATVGNNPNQLTDRVVDVITAHAAGETQFPDYTYIEPVLMIQDNVDEYLDPDSFF